MVVEIKAELDNKVGLLSAHSHRAQIKQKYTTAYSGLFDTNQPCL